LTSSNKLSLIMSARLPGVTADGHSPFLHAVC
jgi:hypothetical protein